MLNYVSKFQFSDSECELYFIEIIETILCNFYGKSNKTSVVEKLKSVLSLH